jgi:hypothetical protein
MMVSLKCTLFIFLLNKWRGITWCRISLVHIFKKQFMNWFTIQIMHKTTALRHITFGFWLQLKLSSIHNYLELIMLMMWQCSNNYVGKTGRTSLSSPLETTSYVDRKNDIIVRCAEILLEPHGLACKWLETCTSHMLSAGECARRCVCLLHACPAQREQYYKTFIHVMDVICINYASFSTQASGT